MIILGYGKNLLESKESQPRAAVPHALSKNKLCVKMEASATNWKNAAQKYDRL